MINVHGSILPAYRGAAPVHRAVMAGDTETGVTIMRVIRELDAGPMFAMRSTPIGPDETSAAVERRVATIGAELLLEIVEQIAAGSASETPQDDSRATYAPKLTKSEGRIDWNQPAETIHNLVRGLQPWPLVVSRLGELRLLIIRTERIGDSAAFTGAVDEDARPGSILKAEADGLVVLCGDRTALRVLEVQPEGKRLMSVRDFLAGHRVQPGSQLETP
jgi:methionyl-tRNA formyltransferase